jgi:hypothetical protein
VNKVVAYLPIVLIVSACASDESARRNPDTARAEAARVHQRDERADGESTDHAVVHREGDHAVPNDRSDTGVAPVAVAPVPADANAPARSDDLSDAEITRRIHDAVNGDKSLTVAAKNVDITTQDKHVTLRGSVPSDRDKDAVGTYARQIAGADNVQNQIDVH